MYLFLGWFFFEVWWRCNYNRWEDPNPGSEMATQQAFEVGGAEFKSSRYRYDHLTVFGVYLSTERSGFQMLSLGIWVTSIFFFSKFRDSYLFLFNSWSNLLLMFYAKSNEQAQQESSISSLWFLL